MKKFFIVFVVFLYCISCAGSPETVQTMPEGTPVTVDTVKFNILKNVRSEGEEIEAEVLYYPANSFFALRFSYQDFTYFQYYNTGAREHFANSFSGFISDQRMDALNAAGIKARRFYGSIKGSLAYEHPRFFGSFASKPTMDFGFIRHNSRTYFSVTQGEANIDGQPSNGRFMSPGFVIFFSNEEARKLVNLFGLDPSPIVCFGDNVTSGYSVVYYGVADHSRAYPAFLQRRINIPVINSGGGRETTERALERIDRDVLAYNPQMVLIFFGAEDLSRQIPWQETRKNLEEMIRRIKSDNRIIFILKFYTESRLNSAVRRWDISDEERAAVIQGYEDMYADFSKMENVEVINDAWKDVWGQHMASDSRNPVLAGQEIMAENIFSAIKPFLEKRNALKEPE